MEDSFDFELGSDYYVTMTDNEFDYLENCTIYYDIDEPYEWNYTSTLIIDFKYTLYENN